MREVNFEESHKVMLNPDLAANRVQLAAHSIDFINFLILFECEGERVHRQYVDLIENRFESIDLSEAAIAIKNIVVEDAPPIEDLFTRYPDIIEDFKKTLPEELKVGLFPYLLLFEIYFDRGANIDLGNNRAVQVFVSIYGLITRMARSLGILSYYKPAFWKEKLGFLMIANTPDDIYDNEYPLYLAGFFQSRSMNVSFLQETAPAPTRTPDFLVSGQDIPLIGETKKLKPREIRDFVQNIGGKIEDATSQIGAVTDLYPNSIGVVFINIPESAMTWPHVSDVVTTTLKDLRWYLNNRPHIGCLILQQRTNPFFIDGPVIDIAENLNTIIIKNEKSSVDNAPEIVTRLSKVFCSPVF